VALLFELEKKYVPIINGFGSSKNFGTDASAFALDATQVAKTESNGPRQFCTWTDELFS
jgi:hypothetical protein